MSRWKSFFMVVAVLLLHHHHQTCDAITNTNNQTCPPSSCGNIRDIKHPFRLMNDPASCGDPKYELSCENNITVLTLFSGKYYVKSINYSDYSIWLVDPGIEEGNCSSLPRYFLSSSNFTTFQSYDYNDADPYDTSYYGHIIYLKCSKAVNDDHEYVDTAPCINSDSKSYLYAFAADFWARDYSDEYDLGYEESYSRKNYFSVGRLKDYCQVKLVAMSTSDFPNVSVREGVPDRSLSYEEIHGMLLYGFQLSWTNKNTYCPPSSCGNITNITHPFRLTDDPTSCGSGDPKYELSCENNITVLTLFSGKYYVKSINYNNYTIRLVDPGIQEGDCSSVPHYSLSSSNFTEFQSYDYNDADVYQIEFHIRYWYIIYLKCSKQVNDDAEYVDAAPCINSDSKTYLYAFAGDSYLSDHSFSAGRLKDYCQVKLVAMSSSDFPSDSVPLSYEEIHGILLYGFELSWMSGPCRELCGEKNGCKLNYTTGDLECSDDYCEYPLGISVNKRCDQLSKGFILVQGYIFKEKDKFLKNKKYN